MSPFFAWNIINFLDAEADWLIKLVILFAIAIVLTKGLKVIFLKLQQRFLEKNLTFQEYCVTAASRPLMYLIWYFVLRIGVDIVTDRLLTQHLYTQTHVLTSVVIILAIAWFLLRWKTAVIRHAINTKTGTDKGKTIVVGKLATAAIFILTALLLLETIGQNVATLIAFGGIGGLALAFASQEVVANFFGGLVIYITQPFHVGDNIRLPSSYVEGTVEDIGWYQTSLINDDKKSIYVPNSLLIKTCIVNGSRLRPR